MPDYRSVNGFLTQFGTFSEREAAKLTLKIDETNLKPGMCYRKAGIHACRISYLSAGIIGAFRITTNGEEKLDHFIGEKQFFANPAIFTLEQVNDYTFKSLTSCRILSVGESDAQQLINEIPAFEKFYYRAREQSLVYLMKSYNFRQNGSPTENYHHLLSAHPELIRQVPLKYIAAYLGITPQTLSHIRKIRE